MWFRDGTAKRMGIFISMVYNTREVSTFLVSSFLTFLNNYLYSAKGTKVYKELQYTHMLTNSKMRVNISTHRV